MKTTVIHHSADFDGIFCREIARKFLPEAELVGWDFSDPPLSPPECDVLYVMDLPLDRPFGFKCEEMVKDEAYEGTRIGKCSNIIWIDHHKSSIESHPKEILGYRIDGVAACRLAWQWFMIHSVPQDQELPSKEKFLEREVDEPLAVRLAGEYDIWDKRDPRADIFQFGLRSVDPGADFFEALLQVDGVGEKAVEELLENGRLLSRYQSRNDAGMMGRSFLVDFEGFKFLALTTARCNSLTFMCKDFPETGHDALMGVYYDGKKWNVSMYHAKHNTGIDLSKIAVKYGGGGHRGACGFQTNKLSFLP